MNEDENRTTMSTEESNNDYESGAKAFRKFVRRPEHYQNEEHYLRIKLTGKFGGWRLREEVYKAFLGEGINDFIFMNDVYVLGLKNIDVEKENWVVDCFAAGEAANWIDDNEITEGDIIEGKFKFAFRLVKNGGGIRGLQNDVHDAKIANLILLEAYKKVLPEELQKSESVDVSSNDSEISDLIKLLFRNVESDESK